MSVYVALPSGIPRLVTYDLPPPPSGLVPQSVEHRWSEHGGRRGLEFQRGVFTATAVIRLRQFVRIILNAVET